MLCFYTDGSFRSSTNEGGFGIVCFNDNEDIIYAHQEQFKNITNNQMELLAIIRVCEIINKYFIKDKIIIYSDSSYCVNSINTWMYTWYNNNWINSKKETIKNLSLIQTLYKYFTENFSGCQIKVALLKGHNNNTGNELADALATKNQKKFINIIEQRKINLLNTDEKFFLNEQLSVQ